MKIWVDADSCPKVIRKILYKAVIRVEVPMTLVANHVLNPPKSPFIKALVVASGFDVADHEIVTRVKAGDLVITSDIPLAAEVMEKGAAALSSRGEMYSAESIKSRLQMRDFMDTMRASGLASGGPAALSETDRKAFADQLDAYLARHAKKA